VDHKVFLTEDAENDLESLYDFIFEHDSPGSAGHVLARIETTLSGLKNFQERGSYPKELAALGIRDYREVFFKHYRIIYRIIERAVYVYLIVDGRRDKQALLQRRLLSAR